MLKNMYEEKRTRLSQAELNTLLLAHERFLAGRPGSLRAKLTHANLDRLNLANRNLTEADFAGASLVGANLSGSNLERASFYCADLRQCNLQSARLPRADLRGASFNGAKLAYALLDNADLRAATMMFVSKGEISIFDRNRESNQNVSANTLGGVDFSNCSMKGVSFGNAKLDNANFTGALLQDANFKGAKLRNATFKNAVLIGVDLKDLAVPPEALAGCVTDVTAMAAGKFDELKAKLDAHQSWINSGGAQGAPGVLDGEDLRPLHQLLVGRSLTGLSARGTVCIGLDFSGSHLQAAKFDGADLRDANFTNSDLRGASLRGTKLTHAKFDRANLCRLAFGNGTTLAPDLTEADAIEEQFFGAILEDKVSALGLSVGEFELA
ncbi:MAG TPA: pentapeptide repeat-containing protein [Rhizomicrobium sp.]